MFYAPAQDTQCPTHPRLHVRDARDAHVVFEAVRRGMLKPVVRRLNELERSTYIRSGALFVWEESDDEMGLKRWTDGKVWSGSRMREPYLFYDEKISSDEMQPADTTTSKCTYRFVDGPSRTWASSAQSHYERSDHHPTGLVKQAAYFTYADLPTIPVIDQDPVLRGMSVPAGIYRSGKARSRTSETAYPSPPPSASPVSRPASPPYRHTSGNSHSLSQKNQIVLPSLQSAIAHTHLNLHAGQHRPHGVRLAEDQRMIQMLNSRPLRRLHIAFNDIPLSLGESYVVTGAR